MKKTVGIALVFCTLVSAIPVTFFAKGSPTESDLNHYLQKAGYPQDVIDSFDIE